MLPEMNAINRSMGLEKVSESKVESNLEEFFFKVFIKEIRRQFCTMQLLQQIEGV